MPDASLMLAKSIEDLIRESANRSDADKFFIAGVLHMIMASANMNDLRTLNLFIKEYDKSLRARMASLPPTPSAN